MLPTRFTKGKAMSEQYKTLCEGGLEERNGAEMVRPQPQQDQPVPQAPQQAPQQLQGAVGPVGQLPAGTMGQAAPFPEWPWGRGTRRWGRSRGRGKKNKTRSRLMPQDPWLQLLAIMANHPAILEWLHRIRTTQHPALGGPSHGGE